MSTIKGISQTGFTHDGSGFRVAIVHARWNDKIVEALVAGAVKKLRERGVKESNIVIQSVPGSFELPFACQKVIAGSHVQTGGGGVTDLLGGLNLGTNSPNPSSRTGTPAPAAATAVSGPFDAVIAIGVLIKGATMHFEYICESVSHALMRVQLDTGVPVIFGVLTALNEEQALDRAGLATPRNLGRGVETVPQNHNHGEDWGLAAIEMASQTRRWAEGKFV